MRYYYMSTNPELMRECAVIMGTAGDIDEELLNESGDGSPEKAPDGRQVAVHDVW